MTIKNRVFEIVIVITTIVIMIVFCKHMSDRIPYKTKEEFELTRSEPRIDGNSCAADERLAILVHSAARSSGQYFDKRQAVRQTWASVAKEQYNVRTYFAIALNPKDSVNSELQSEAEQHQDMIQFRFIDAYYNLTLKNVALLRWVSRKCPHLKYILKTDDDVIVNIELLNGTLDQFESGIHGGGSMRIEKVPRRDHKSKVLVEYYPNDTYPKFVYGGAYLMSTDSIGKLLTTIDSYTDYVLDIDDSFITGVIADKAGVPRYWDSRFGYIWTGCHVNDKNLCRMCSLIAWVECKTNQEMLKFYPRWQQYDCSCPFSLLWILTILFIIIFVVISVVVVWVVIFKKNKTSQPNTN